MPGGLLNIAAYGTENIILTGNPKKTYFRATYKKYTNFGLQRFRLDFEGQRTLNFNSETEMVFKIPRYAELLWDSYLVVNLPDIWSPFYWNETVNGCVTPYEFQWIDQLGALMIKDIIVYTGGSTLAEYSGEYLAAAIQRDEGTKRELWDRMVGSETQFTDPANAFQNGGFYPNAQFQTTPPAGLSGSDVVPSIQGKKLFIPIETWFGYKGGKTAFPLVSTQYQELEIKIRFRPIKELYTILNVEDPSITTGKGVRKAPNASSAVDQLWWFLQPPQDPNGVVISPSSSIQQQNMNRYIRKNNWNADIHLMSCYVFLSNDERRTFAAQRQSYLVKQTYQHDFLNSTGSKRVDIPSRDMVSNYLFRFRRSDVNLRNQWVNYTNWAFENKQPHPTTELANLCPPPSGLNPYLFKQTAPLADSSNLQYILLDLAILLGSEYRENVLDAGVFNLVEKWIRSDGVAKDGLYLYSFAINTNRANYQPSGAQNVNKWQYVTFEFNTIQPPIDPENNDMQVLCDDNGAIIGVRKDNYNINKWNYDLRVWEERYNMVIIEGGRVGLLHAR